MDYIASVQPERMLRYAVYSVRNRMDDGLVFTRFLKAYELHKEYLKTVGFEKEYAPMFVNRYGKAMSYET